MYYGWLSFGGTEIVNSSRTVQYAQRFGVPIGCGDDCPNLNVVLGDDSYQTGFVVPWDDPSQPSGFLGFRGMNVTGMGNGTLRNIVTDLPGDGAAIGIGRRGRRELLVQVMGVAVNDEALDYGIAWLNSVLRGAICGPTGTCQGSTLCFYDRCPDCTDMTADECNQEHLKNLFNVGVLEPPTVVSRGNLPGTCETSSEQSAWVVLEFTLVAGIPYIYDQPTFIGGSGVWNINDVSGFTECPDGVDCSTNPDCPAPSVPPVVPVPVATCLEPLPGLVDSQWLTMTGSETSDWFEKVPYVEIFSGATAMKSFGINFYRNPTGGTCDFYTTPGLPSGCYLCASIFVPYLPANSTMVIDGRVERATIACNQSSGSIVTGETGTNEAIVYGLGGTIYPWTKFECAEPMCIQVYASTDWRADDATVSLSMVERKDSA